MFPIHKTSGFHQYFYRPHKIRKSGSTTLYDITTFKKQFLFKRISISTQKHNKYLWFSKMYKIIDNDPSKWVPHSIEPFASSKDEDSDSEENVQQQSSSNSRIGNTEWCKCNNCWQMETNAEFFLCRSRWNPQTYLKVN